MRRRLRFAGALVAAGLLAVALEPGHGTPGGVFAGALGGGASAVAADLASEPPTANDTFTPELGLPATNVVAFGASPLQAPGEAWAYGELPDAPASVEGHGYSGQWALLKRTDASGWQVLPLPPSPEGGPLAGPGEADGPAAYGALGGQATADGGVVLLTGRRIVVRDPNGSPRLVPAPEAIGSGPGGGGVLAAGEALLPAQASSGLLTIPYAAIEEVSQHEEVSQQTGLLIAPFHDGGNPSGSPHTQPGVLHYDGGVWTREPIDVPPTDEDGFAPQALACGGTGAAPASSAPQNCWLLASAKVPSANGVQTVLLLFRRTSSAQPPGYAWEPEPVSDWLLGDERAPSGVAQHTVVPLEQGTQMLTATAQGVWVDFQATVNGATAPIDVSELVTPGSPTAAVIGTWCYPAGVLCPAEHSLGAPLPARYRSFAWPAPGSASGVDGDGVGGDPGIRIVTGLGDHAMLELAEDGSFSYTIGAGGETGFMPGGAAFSSPAQGWIADGADPTVGADGEGQSQVVELGTQPGGDQLQEEAVPFRRPLLALAQAPGTVPGDQGAEAIAVGVEGQVAHYTPGEGWRPEALYNSAGTAQTPTLRGVAWPEPTRAYAVGDNGAMWLWRSETGLWEPDPAKPFNFIGNLTAIAFSPSNPQLGYAVGKQGVILRYGKSWEQVPLPPELQQANFTSVAFAGNEALAVYRTLEGGDEVGGVAVQEGTEPWHVDPGVAALLNQLPTKDRVLAKIAGLPDGGVVAAGPGIVLERESPGAPWSFSAQPLPEAQNVSALAAYREGSPAGPVRAVVSIDLDRILNPQTFDGNLEQGPFAGDVPPPTGPGQPPPFIGPDPLPNSGYVLKQTADGWVDMEHEALPANVAQPSDQPIRPDPVLALLVDPTGTLGLAVGGQTENALGADNGSAAQEGEAQTAAAMRFPAAASGDGSTPRPVATPAGEANFVVGGEAACALACADFANESLGPDVWLRHALQSAAAIAGQSPGALRAFLYTGGRLRQSAGLAGEAFERELDRYAAMLGAGGPLPVLAADSADVAPPGVGSGPFARILAPFTPEDKGVGLDYYPFSTDSSGGAVKVIVLDYSAGALGSEQEAWLSSKLTEAKDEETPAIVMGSDSLGFALPGAGTSGNEARDAGAVAKILLQPGASASAYFFDYPGANVKTQISDGAESIPAFGSGTLGYAGRGEAADSLASSGYLLASVHANERKSGANIVPVTAEVVPNIAQLALDATDGVLLRRSQVGLFQALARRPLAGEEAAGQSGAGNEIILPNPYDQIPFDCVGPNCAYEVPTQYTFSSSNPDIGNFVAPEPGSINPRQVQLGANKLPVPDPHSGLFCAYNEGTTTVSITAGGLTYSEPVKVQGGSVEYPCGTVPLKNPPLRPAAVGAAVPVAGLAPSGSPPPSPLGQALVPPPPPAAPVKPPHQLRRVPPPAAPIPFLPLVPSPFGARPVIVPAISPPVARPIPPSGTSQVYQSMAVPQRQREREAAGELSSNEFSAYDPHEGGWPGLLIVPLAILASGAGVGIGRGMSRRRRQRPAFARARVERCKPTQRCTR